MSRGSLGLSPPSCVLSPATHGTRLALWQPAGKLIKRVGNDLLGVGPQPQIVGDDLDDVADQLIARHKRRLASDAVQTCTGNPLS